MTRSSAWKRTAASGALCAFAFLLRGGTAYADDADAARAAMRRGLEALERRDATTALAEYETAKRLVPAANAPYYFAASALEILGRWREAVENLEAYLAKDPTVSDISAVKERIGHIRTAHFPARLHVRVTGSEEATVFVDGEPKGRPGAIELTPGSHRIEARAPSRLASAQAVDLAGDTEESLTLALPPPAPIEGPPRALAPLDPGSAPSTWRTAGWISAGVGTATLATAFVLDALVLGPKIDDYDAAARGGDPAGRALRGEAEELQTAVLTTYVAGAIIAAGGVALALFAPRASSIPTRAHPASAFARTGNLHPSGASR